MISPVIHAGALFQDEVAPVEDDRRQSRCEDKRPHVIDEIVVDFPGEDGVCPCRSEGLPEGSHEHIHLWHHTLLRRESGSPRSSDSDSVCLVDHEDCAELPLEGGERPHVRLVSVHAEDRLRDDEDSAVCVLVLGQERMQMLHVEMPVAFEFGVCQPESVDDAGVVQLVRED